MIRRTAIILPIIIITVVFLGYGLVDLTRAQQSPHGNYTPSTDACSGCHQTHAGVAGYFLLAEVSDLCNICHGAGALGAASTDGAATIVSTHGNGSFSKRSEEPFQLECAQCHDPHPNGNLFGLRQFVRLSSRQRLAAGPVIFAATSGPNSFDDGASPVSSRICVSCHANPKNPGFPMVYHAGGNHGNTDYTGQDCISCHPHDADGDPATPDGFMPVAGDFSPARPIFNKAIFNFDEPAGSEFVAGQSDNRQPEAASSAQLLGRVSDPADSIIGDGYFRGDGIDNYIIFDNDPASLQASSLLTVEMRLKPTWIPTDTTDYMATIFDRGSNNYEVSLLRMNSWTSYNAPFTATSIALWITPVETRGGPAWKPVLTDYDRCPLVIDHWYQIKIAWDSGKTEGLPADIYVDDQGPGGNNVGQAWPDSINCTDANQMLVPGDSKLHIGDQMQTSAGDFTLAASAANPDNYLFNGLIDWIKFNQVSQAVPTRIYLPFVARNTVSSPGGQPAANAIYLPVIKKDGANGSILSR